MKNLYASILIVTAASVGAGILLFPILLASLGFLWSVALLLVCWGVTTYTAFLFLEITLWFPPGSHFMQMGQKLLGRPLASISWCIYLLMMYLLLSVYMTSLMTLLTNILSYYDYSLQHINWLLLVGIGISAILLYFAKSRIHYGVAVLTLILLLCFIVFAVLTIPHLHVPFLTHSDHSFALNSLPIILLAFGYHFIIPRVRDGIEGEQFKNARRILFFASLLLAMLYIIWLFIIFCALPLLNIYGFMHYLYTPTLTTNVQNNLLWHLGSSWVMIGHAVLLFALLASFFMIANSLYNFTATSFKISGRALSRLGVIAFIFIPPLGYAFLLPQQVLLALTIIGICTIYLYVVAPVVMIWLGRYYKQFSFGYRVKGGRLMLLGIGLLGLALLAVQARLI